MSIEAWREETFIIQMAHPDVMAISLISEIKERYPKANWSAISAWLSEASKPKERDVFDHP